MHQISMVGVSFRYGGALRDSISNLNLDILRGEIITILGGDGAGKTTLCKILNGLIPHSVKGTLRGDVVIDGKLTREALLPEIVGKVGLCLQDPDMQLFSNSVEEEVAFGPENFAIPHGEIEERVKEALEFMGLSSLAGKSPNALSGGQKQRLAIASVLSMRPEVVVLDEPLSMLDPRGRQELLGTLKTLRAQRGTTVILTDNSAEEHVRFCDRMVLLHEGALISQGTPHQVLLSARRLRDIGISPPEILELSDRLSSAGSIPSDSVFLTEGEALHHLRQPEQTGGARR